MPVSRARGGNALLDQLDASAPTRAANNALPITAYYRACDLLLSQAKVYRVSGNDEQLYVMLMRFASLFIETIPRHTQFSKQAGPYKKFEPSVLDALKELEHLRAALKLRNVEQPTAHTISRPADAALLVTSSDLPGIDWASVGAGSAASAAAAAASASSRFGAEAAEWLARVSSGAAAGPSGQAPGRGGYGGSFSSGGYGGASSGGGGDGGGSFTSGPAPPAAYQSAYVPSSHASLERHALFAPRPSPGARAAAAAAPPRPRYPDFDKSPAAAIDLLWQPPGQQQQQQQQLDGAAAAPPAPPEDALSGLALSERRAGAAPGPGGSLLDAPMAPLPLQHPSAGLALGPQELPVHSMDPSLGHPGGTCALTHAQQQPGPQAQPEPGGPRPLAKRVEMRDVHISVALMNDFLQYASANTRRGIESCGILAGTLNAGDSVFRVTTLIIPKQEGTTDTVAALNEEEIYEAQASRELYPLGWIHTHPTQTCFLSSVDVHTQCGYQTMLDEAVAIVMAPTDRRNKCGIFRLTTPGGLQLVQKCALRGFHTHPPTATGQEVYELCGHVYLNPRAKHEVLDLR